MQTEVSSLKWVVKALNMAGTVFDGEGGAWAVRFAIKDEEDGG